jgi:hypothetical protein
MTLSAIISAGPRTAHVNPFVWLAPERPAAALGPEALECVPYLAAFVGDSAGWLVSSLVAFACEHLDGRGRAQRAATVTSVRNRRRRAATLWVQAILAGRADPDTLHQLTTSWLPQLVGSGPDLWHGARAGRDAIEYLRGACTARIVVEPQDNLIAEARALHALEAVLAAHLFAWQAAVARSRHGETGTAAPALNPE